MQGEPLGVSACAADGSPGVSRTLAQFIERTRWGDVPAAVQHEAVRALVNYFAAALAGCASPVIERAAAVFAPFSASAAAGLIGRRERTDVLNAAGLNAMSANVHDFDDTHLPTVIHPTALVAAPLFAVAQSTRMSGEQLLLALVLGVECSCRIGLAVSPGHYRRGWHISSTCGVFGAAAAAGKALQLDAEHLVWAFGQASAQAAGVLENLGTMAKSLGVGHAARGGLLAALLAAQDFSGPREPLTGRRGFLRVSSEQVDPAAALDRLGSEWALLCTGYKPYPCGIVLHAAIDACLQLREDAADASWSSAAIEHIELTGHPLLRERADRPRPASSSEAQVSAQHAVAVALARGRAGLADFTDESIADPELQALRQRVVLVDDPDFAIEAARVAVTLRSGRTVECRVDTPRGAPARALSDTELESKLRELAAYGASGIAVQPLLDSLWGLPHASDAGAIMRAAVRPAAAASVSR
ncbi:MAG TPA: MmgE/PrpD family protein [Steroidobacteraceae bacterium]